MVKMHMNITSVFPDGPCFEMQKCVSYDKVQMEIFKLSPDTCVCSISSLV